MLRRPFAALLCLALACPPVRAGGQARAVSGEAAPVSVVPGVRLNVPLGGELTGAGDAASGLAPLVTPTAGVDLIRDVPNPSVLERTEPVSVQPSELPAPTVEQAGAQALVSLPGRQTPLATDPKANAQSRSSPESLGSPTAPTNDVSTPPAETARNRGMALFWRLVGSIPGLSRKARPALEQKNELDKLVENAGRREGLPAAEGGEEAANGPGSANVEGQRRANAYLNAADGSAPAERPPQEPPKPPAPTARDPEGEGNGLRWTASAARGLAAGLALLGAMALAYLPALQSLLPAEAPIAPLARWFADNPALYLGLVLGPLTALAVGLRARWSGRGSAAVAASAALSAPWTWKLYAAYPILGSLAVVSAADVLAYNVYALSEQALRRAPGLSKRPLARALLAGLAASAAFALAAGLYFGFAWKMLLFNALSAALFSAIYARVGSLPTLLIAHPLFIGLGMLLPSLGPGLLAAVIVASFAAAILLATKNGVR
ncbi:MAG TPA: hypothetical protein VNI01_00455 [Elusimicrobiota bacterium]|nr:hypothetical protein [Elusimicrobiota bacterium]